LELLAFLSNGGAPPNDSVKDNNVVNRAPTLIGDGGGGRSYHCFRLPFMSPTMVRKKTPCSPLLVFSLLLLQDTKKEKRRWGERKGEGKKKKNKEGEGPLY
jgi:hypothetical protein